jgi:hypothetical protein
VFFLGILGVLADSLNHLVFTMPFLPSEGEETKLLINQQMKDVLVFHYLPILWYRYPIPNEIREFWYNERPDILNYMQKAYKDLDIQFLPDKIVQQLNQQKLQADLAQSYDSFIGQTNSISDQISTEILAKNNLIQGHEFFPYLNSIHENVHNFCMTHLDKLF